MIWSLGASNHTTHSVSSASGCGVLLPSSTCSCCTSNTSAASLSRFAAAATSAVALAAAAAAAASAAQLPSQPYHTARHPSAAARVTGAPPSRRTRSDRTQRRGSGWPHIAVKQHCHKVTHTSLVAVRPPASSCQLRRGERRSTPFDGLGPHTSLGGCMDDIAASCHFESCNYCVR
jgi:hypothetical protein